MRRARVAVWGAILIIISAPHVPAPIIEETTPLPTTAPKRKPPRELATVIKSHVGATDVSIKPATSGGPATVFIYRPAGFPWGIYNTSTVMMDGIQIRTMSDPRYSVRKLSPGRHVFEVKGGFTNQHVPIQIDLQSAQTYYLRVSIDAMGFPEGKIIFTQVPNAQGAEEIAKLTQGP
jgi:hypothetical protein